MFVDEILGNFETRYFGAGHKRTQYKLSNIFTISEGYNQASAQIIQHDQWSEKNGVQMEQHLSTIDGVVLASMCAEKYIEANMKDVSVASLFLASFSIKSGTKPIEDLKNIPLTIEVVSDSLPLLRFKVVIVGMKIELVFKEFSNKKSTLVFSKKEERQEEVQHYISNHLKYIRHDIGNIVFSNDDCLFCEITKKEDLKEYTGMGQNFKACMSIFEWLVIFSQMSQLLAYNYDLITRQNSDTLWMKQVKAEIDESFIYEKSIPAIGRIQNARLLNIGTDIWRLFEMNGYTINNNVRFSGKIVHRLPENKREEEFCE